MTTAAVHHAHATTERALPPVAGLGIGALVAVVASGVYLAATAGRHQLLAVPIALLAVAAVLVVAAVILLVRIEEFAWGKFKTVGGWALLEYAVFAGMLTYVFVLDHVPTSSLILLLISLALFAVDIPMMFGFSVARFQPADGAPQGTR